MVNCKICNKEYHACSSCGIDHDWQWRYCSEHCWRRSEEYTLARLEIEVAQMKLGCKLEDLFFSEEVLFDMINNERISII